MFQFGLFEALFESDHRVRFELFIFGVVFNEEVNLLFHRRRAAQLDGLGVFEGERKRRSFLRFVLL